MTLAEIRAAHPGLFHPNQDWFNGHGFMDRLADQGVGMPDRVAPNAVGYMLWPEPQSAATLALLYVGNPESPIWERYLWTADTDDLGQRVYMGKNERGMEIHRHLHLTERWGLPVWDDAA